MSEVKDCPAFCNSCYSLQEITMGLGSMRICLRKKYPVMRYRWWDMIRRESYPYCKYYAEIETAEAREREWRANYENATGE